MKVYPIFLFAFLKVNDHFYNRAYLLIDSEIL